MSSDGAPTALDRLPEPAPMRQSSPDRHPLHVPIFGIFLILVLHGLIFASEFLLPVTSAILAYFILNAPRRVLQNIGIPAPVVAALFTSLIAGVLVLGVAVLSDPIYDFVTDIPMLLQEMVAQLTGPGGPLEPFTVAAEATEDALATAGSARPMPVEIVSDGGIATSVVSLAPSLLSQFVFSVCLLFFLVASGDLFIQKAVQVADRFEDKRKTFLLIRRIEARLGNYLGAITLINAGLGIAIGLGMWWWDMPAPAMIGGMAAVLNFIPFVGAVIGAVVAGLIGYVTFMDPFIALGVFGTYYALTALEGQLITPALVGQRLRLNTTMVFLSVAFFAWIWSVMGMVVAVPMLIVVKVVCDAVPRLRKIGLFLGDAEGFVPRDEPETEDA